MNPYQPTTQFLEYPSVRRRVQATTLAGAWLAGCGVLHFFALHFFTDVRARAEFFPQPLLLVLVGWAIMFQIGPWMKMIRRTRAVILWIAILGILALFIGSNAGMGFVYGSMVLWEPQPWQSALLVASIVLTALPPCWILSTASRQPEAN